MTVTHEAADPAQGMTVSELHELVTGLIETGVAGDALVRVKTKFGANRHGSLIKSVTVASDERGTNHR